MKNLHADVNFLHLDMKNLHADVKLLHIHLIYLRRLHLKSVRLYFSCLICLIEFILKVSMLYSGSQPIYHTPVAKSCTLIHPHIVVTFAPMHKFVSGDGLFDTILMKSPGMTNDIDDHLQFCQVGDMSNDINHFIGQREEILRRRREARKLFPFGCIAHTATSISST